MLIAITVIPTFRDSEQSEFYILWNKFGGSWPDEFFPDGFKFLKGWQTFQYIMLILYC